MGVDFLSTRGLISEGTNHWTSCLKPDEVDQFFKLFAKFHKPGADKNDARDKAKAKILAKRK